MLKTSINIKYDHDNKQLISDYYATNSHTKLILDVISSTFLTNRLSAHIAFGPYGSGKSYISAILSRVLSKNLTIKETKQFVLKFSVISDSVKKCISDFNKNKIKYIPILLNGFIGDFEETIIYEINKELKNENINIETDDIFNSIGSIIFNWQKDFPNTYQNFLDLLQEYGYNIVDFNSRLKTFDKTVLIDFNEIYSTITSGVRLKSNSKQSLVKYLENVLNQLKKQNIGLFLVYDEFGRLLQNIEESSLSKFMGDFQDLAELANNGADNVQVGFIAHKPITHYFSYQSMENRAEFAKVEKRFNTHEIRSDYGTFLNITEGFLKSKNLTKESDNIQDITTYNVFDGLLSDKELDGYTSRFFPFHPITLYLLPRVSKVFGQNERTLFTFLNDNDRNGLIGHILESDDLFYPDQLVDYFFTNIDDTYIEESKEFIIYRKKISDLKKRNAKNKHDSIRVFKFILLWQISRNDSDIKLLNKFLEYSLSLDSNKIQSAITTLVRMKVLRFNQLKNEYEIFEGSPLNIEKEMDKQIAQSLFEDELIMTTLTEINPNKYVYSKRHNAKNEITRFSKLIFTTKNIGNSFSADDIIPVCFKSYADDIDSEIMIISNTNFSQISKVIQRIIVLRKMMKMHYYIASYQNIGNEFEYELNLNLDKLQKMFFEIFSSKSKILFNNKAMKINCLVDFEIFLSNRYDLMYDKSIHIVNDQVNMFKLTKIQKNAMVHVLNRIMNYSTIENELYYQGSKPSDLIFYTLVKNVKEVYNNGKFIANLKGDLERFLKSNNQDYLYKLFDIAMSSPYGLRPHVAIIIVFDLIKDFWNDILLFMNNSFIPTIDSYELYDSILNRVPLQYSFSIFDNDHKELLTQLERLFDDIPLQIQGKSSTIRVCSGMYTWYMNLPVITQQKINVSLSGMQFLSVISSSRTNPKDAILTLINGYTIGDIISFKHEIEAHFDVYLDSIRSNILKRLGIRNKLSWIDNQPLITRKNNLFAYSLNNKKDFIETYSDKIENIHITKWTESSFDKLKETIILDVKSLNKDTKYNSIVVNGLEKHVQDVQLTRKAKTAYDNLINLIEATSRYYSDMELEQIVLMIIKKYIK